jgi:hypothetical protein
MISLGVYLNLAFFHMEFDKDGGPWIDGDRELWGEMKSAPRDFCLDLIAMRRPHQEREAPSC